MTLILNIKLEKNIKYVKIILCIDREGESYGIDK